mgnify:FL=1
MYIYIRFTKGLATYTESHKSYTLQLKEYTKHTCHRTRHSETRDTTFLTGISTPSKYAYICYVMSVSLDSLHYLLSIYVYLKLLHRKLTCFNFLQPHRPFSSSSLDKPKLLKNLSLHVIHNKEIQ